MYRRLLIPSLFLITSIAPSLEAAPSSFIFNSNVPTHIEVNNRILANVNGKPISVYDVMKKMDMIFFRQYPQYADNVEAKFQFYTVNWKYTLRDLIDKELILTDAEEIKLQVSNGDIRQEMETTFGPNIIANLDKVGMTYEEAQEIIKDDQTIRRMMNVRVNMKAIHKVTPQAIRSLYEEFSKENIRIPEWDYYVISIQDKDSTKAAHSAYLLHHLITEEQVPIDQIQARAAAKGILEPTTRLNVSNKFHHNEKEVSDSYREILSSMIPNTYTQPFVHKARKGDQKIFRIFMIESMVPGGMIPFYEVENKLIEQLRNKIFEEESDAYLDRLRKHFKIDEKEILNSLPPNFQPFVLK